MRSAWLRSSSLSATLKVHEAIGTVVLEEAEAEHAHDLEGTLARRHAKRRQRALRRQHFDAITQADPQLLREVLPKDDARHRPLDGRQRVEAPDNMDRPTLVTPGSSDGSTPLIVMNWLPPALFASPVRARPAPRPRPAARRAPS